MIEGLKLFRGTLTIKLEAYLKLRVCELQLKLISPPE